MDECAPVTTLRGKRFKNNAIVNLKNFKTIKRDSLRKKVRRRKIRLLTANR